MRPTTRTYSVGCDTDVLEDEGAQKESGVAAVGAEGGAQCGRLSEGQAGGGIRSSGKGSPDVNGGLRDLRVVRSGRLVHCPRQSLLVFSKGKPDAKDGVMSCEQE
jgi:hypothetical protein